MPVAKPIEANPTRLLLDSHGRRITYLRLSVTDRCQFRCVYCMPPEGIQLLPREDYLSTEEMETLVRTLAGLGVNRVRLTGGEPLLRKDIVEITSRLSAIDGITDVALTTNGELLPPLIKPLQSAGLQRVNISLDSLDPVRFAEVTLSNAFEKVWDAIHLSLQAGLKVKVNAVVMKGITDREIEGFARLAYDHPLEMRFIEFMPLCGTGWKPELTVPIDTVRSRIASYYDLVPLSRGTEVAESYQLAGGRGRIGFIGSMTEPFCSSCSRIRISATGQVQLCLFSNATYNLLPLIRDGAGVEELQNEFLKIIRHKPAMHPWASGSTDELPEANAMIRSIGG